MGTKQKNETGIGVIGRRAISTLPQRIADTRARRANVCVRVVPVDAPRLEHSVDVAVVTGTAYVIDDLIAAILDQCVANLFGERVEDFVPGCSLPLAFAAGADSFEREENSLRIVKLIDRGGTFSAVAASRRGMKRIAFELLDFAGVLVYVSEQPAGGFAIETGCGRKRIAPLDFFRPAPGVVLDPVIPFLVRWIA